MTLAILALLAAMVSIQFGASMATRLFPLIGAPATTALRLGMAAIMLAVVFRPWRVAIPRQSRLSLLGYGISLGCMNLLFYSALTRIPLGIAVALEFVGPLAVTISHARRARDFAWLALVVFGLYFLLPLHTGLHAVGPAGAAMALGAGACWAIYMIFGKRIGGVLGMQAPALGTIIAAVLVVPIGMIHAGAALLAPHVLLAGLLVALFSSAIPYSLEILALTRLSAPAFGTLVSVEPAIAALMGLTLLGEHLVLTQWLAILSIIVAAIGTTTVAEPA